MSSEQNGVLRPKATNAPRITMVKLISPIQFLGISGSQIAPSMAGGLFLRKTDEGVMVTSTANKTKAYHVYAANIAHVEYTEDEK